MQTHMTHVHAHTRTSANVCECIRAHMHMHLHMRVHVAWQTWHGTLRWFQFTFRQGSFHERLKLHFKMLDRDGSGEISVDEVHAMLKRVAANRFTKSYPKPSCVCVRMFVFSARCRMECGCNLRWTYWTRCTRPARQPTLHGSSSTH